MSDFSINEMLEMQKALQDKYKHKWEPICPEARRANRANESRHCQAQKEKRIKIDG